ncbi:hypothetical protein AB6A40_000665 [Gnathostoma spinigerum]|uniref:Nitric oxide synthase-interacting protein homolog n=1 Tax=Gnathostoma spinigerum TaxID=75299 RepID=A0ABD6E3S5_9BILA
MTRHGKNSTASAVYSYSERKKDAKESGYGTLHERLGADSVKEFDCCSITLQPCRDPVISPQGYIFDKEAILEYYLKQKKENTRKLKEWEAQCKREEEEAKEVKLKREKEKLNRFTAIESTPVHPGSIDNNLLGDSPTTSSESVDQRRRKHHLESANEVVSKKARDSANEISNMYGERKNQFPSFWVPQLLPDSRTEKFEKPDQRVLCPVSGKPLKIKELMPVKFTPVPSNDEVSGRTSSDKVRYMCPVTHDALTNATRCAYLKTSQCVVTMDCIERVIRKEMIDPINGKPLKESDIIELQRGGTGFCSTNEVKAKLVRPQLELQ